MNIHRVTALALVVVVLLAGCSSIGPLSGPQSPTETQSATQSATATDTTTPTQTTTATPTKTSTPTPTSTPYVATPPPTPSATATETWTQPETPKDPESKSEDRISSVKFVNKEEASSGSGYTDFDIQVNANTLFQNVDPTPSVDGEPYFYVEINGEPIARDEVRLRQDGTFTIEIHPGALEQFDSGTLNVRVSLFDVDHKHDDRYDTWTGTIEYAGSDNNSNTSNGSS